ncbi:MAG: thermonuclease family protein [Candidatus Omnitrophica bacterium]|nr:thermonuclease family protein [Candidatus Omnitrophota bacterium]
MILVVDSRVPLPAEDLKDKGFELQIDHVIDGDTARLSDGRTARYLGIDTPEVRRKGRNGWEYAPEPFAEAATELNEELVGGKTVFVVPDEKVTDKYGRVLLYVFVGDVFVNEEIVLRGLARVTVFPPNIEYLDVLLRAQEVAREERRGIWGVCANIDVREAHGHVGEVCSVTGEVKGIKETRSEVVMEIKGNGVDVFNVTIFKGNLRFFEAEKKGRLSEYLGKKICVTGKVTEEKGIPGMVLYHPYQIRDELRHKLMVYNILHTTSCHCCS